MLDHCDYAVVLSADGEDAAVKVSQLRKLIIDEYGGDPRAIQPLPTLPSRTEGDDG